MKNRALILLILLSAVVSCSNKVSNQIKPDDAASDENEDFVDVTDEDTDDFSIVTDLKVEKNEKNVLSCRVHFFTAEKIKIMVRYFSKDHSGYEIVEDKPENEHYFFLWGMRQDSKYTIEFYSADKPEILLEKTEYKSGILPDSVPAVSLSVSEPEKVSGGFVLFTTSATVAYMAMPVALMVDTEGEVVWYFEYYMAGFNILGDLQYIEETSTILISLCKGPNMEDIPAEEAIEIDLEGNVIWKSPEFVNLYDEKGSWNHIYERLNDDTIVMLRSNPIGTLLTEDIVNIDRDYKELWKWKYTDHLEVPDCDPSTWCEWTHSNSVTMIKDKKTAYVNSRNLSTVFKIDMETGNIVWKFGKEGSFKLETDNPEPWFEVSHDPEIKDGKILFYDNGTVDRGFSRVIEYKINEENMTAEITFEFDGSKTDQKWFTEYWGDADSMENGNIFVTAGDYQLVEPSRFFEVTRDGFVVWELLMNMQEDWMVTLYNGQKFVPPLMPVK